MVGTANARPGHAGGGEVLGELLGDHIVDWSDDGSILGQATLLTGAYDGSNFLFRQTTVADGLDTNDPLLGYTIALSRAIVRAVESWTYSMVFDVEAATALVGAPFRYDSHRVVHSTIALELATIDPFEGDTIFDGIEFADLDPDADGHIVIEPGQTAHNALRRSFTKHDFYDDLVSEQPNVAFDLFAIADDNGDGDGVVSKAELMALDIRGEERYQVGNFDITDLWGFLDQQVSTVGHIDGEGHCNDAVRQTN